MTPGLKATWVDCSPVRLTLNKTLSFTPQFPPAKSRPLVYLPFRAWVRSQVWALGRGQHFRLQYASCYFYFLFYNDIQLLKSNLHNSLFRKLFYQTLVKPVPSSSWTGLHSYPKFCQTWDKPEIPATVEAKVGGRNSKPAWELSETSAQYICLWN